ncbi:MAG: NADH-quinone oxidoreductase subunit H [Theionarchaea archaeon]|nr:NADH-quinone oxidoreductase subunit H [Theionarchaea archaeon]
MWFILRAVAGPFVVAFVGIFFGLFYKGIDRILHARMQKRVGPPVWQPFFDVKKLLIKANLVPENAIDWLFNLMPVLSLVSVISILLYIPLGSEPLLSTKGDLILILYLLMLPAICLMLGAFASSSPFATVGAQREMVMMISYEFPLAVTIIAMVWRLSKLDAASNVFTLEYISTHPLWGEVGVFGVIGLVILLVVLLSVIPIEMSSVPFDVPEAQSEIAGGLLAEYSGKNLAMFYMSDAVKSIVMAGLVVALFFPYGISHYFGSPQYISYIIDFAFFLLKTLIVIFVSVTLVRTAFARYKIDQVTYVFWVPVTVTALMGLLLLYLDVLL